MEKIYMNYNDKEHINMTTLNDLHIQGVHMGLNNNECENPVYFCKCHKIYLSPADVKEKKCTHKLTQDMISYTTCNWLCLAAEYEEYIKTKNDNIKNLSMSHKNERNEK